MYIILDLIIVGISHSVNAIIIEDLSNVSKELAIALENLGWQEGDNIAVEIGGTSVYEI